MPGQVQQCDIPAPNKLCWFVKFSDNSTGFERGIIPKHLRGVLAKTNGTYEKALEKSFFSLDTIRSLKFRARAYRAFKSENFDNLRKERIERGGSPWKIISYRRVIDPKELPFPIGMTSYVSPKVFEKHLRYLSRECRVLRLSHLLSLIDQHKEIPDRAVAVTIDGGHMDTYVNAFPLLLKYEVPATVFLHTGYIESNTFLFDDRLVMCLLLLKGAGLTMPIFECLDERLYHEMSEIWPDGEISMETINYFVNAIEEAPRTLRAQVMHELAEFIATVTTLPEYEDFMRWNDVRHMRDKGIEFGSMGHWAVAHPVLTREEFATDFAESQRTMEDQGITAYQAHCIPDGVYCKEIVEVMAKLNVRYAVWNGYFPEPRYQESLPMMLARIPMFQAAAFCTELFACRLWELELSGVRY